jgi:F-type H+-transporting ATPase subunit epsilon
MLWQKRKRWDIKMLKLFVVTEEGLKVKEDVDMVYVKAYNGDVTILPNHAWYVTILEQGKFYYKKDNDTKHYKISDGIMEVKDNNVRIITQDLLKNN